MTNTKTMRGAWSVALVVAAVWLSGCMATVGVANVQIPPDAAQTCDRHCQTIGMRLSAVAIMAENVGCICQFPAAPHADAGAGAAGELGAPPAGMSTITIQQAMIAAAALQQQQQRQLQQQQQQRRTYH